MSTPPTNSNADAHSHVSKDRRDFLQRVTTAGALAASAALTGACAPAMAMSSSRQSTTPTQSNWDMSWRDKLGRYRTAFESPEIMSGAALHFASSAMSGYKDAMQLADGEFTPVLILRHTASVMTLNDDMWKRLALGEMYKLKDPTTGEPALRNPFINWKQGDEYSHVGQGNGLDALVSKGAIVLTCNRALMGVAYQLRRKEPSLSVEQAMNEVRAATLPGVYIMPNGIFATVAAQDAGCHYMRVLV